MNTGFEGDLANTPPRNEANQFSVGSSIFLLFPIVAHGPQHFLNFLPLPHGHGSLRPTFGAATYGADEVSGSENPWSLASSIDGAAAARIASPNSVSLLGFRR